MLRVGITGGIGSGKSTVCRIFETLGVPVYYADEEAKKLISNDANVKAEIIKLLGEEAYLNGDYNVPFVKKAVFQDASLLTSLNGIVHPAVKEHAMEWMEAHADKPYVLKEAAIMKKGTDLDKIIYVSASEEIRLARILERDTERTEEEIRAIMKNQFSPAYFEEISDFIIENENDLLIPQVLAIHQKLITS
ncbi:dephospho-CoA kinase [Arcticibacterium luteifluviistationis]|uniref:Dephospho-CoA kinase n=1 Tax=Arcticibacterium luteifluviistationis TaxID=1784714 RepID=A0A2Z4G689_9BACT|nr:dephospho-CoA kinase [Arcticibacterium luteifluviistationis]AWV96663.1 dephospho-CoA kinase [Arcticibacterium luteifluviistationis]